MRTLELDPIEGGSANDYDYCSADPINCYDLGGTHAYSFSYDLGTSGSPEGLAAFAIANCGTVFGTGGCQNNFIEGQRLDLFVKAGRYTQGFPVRVKKMTSTSFQFLALKGHPEGAGRLITFRFYRRKGRNRLRVFTSSNGSPLTHLWGVRNVNFSLADSTWAGFAANLRNQY